MLGPPPERVEGSFPGEHHVAAGDPELGPMLENHGANNSLSSAHTGGVQALLLDGSVQFLADTINLNTMYCLGMRDDAQACSEF